MFKKTLSKCTSLFSLPFDKRNKKSDQSQVAKAKFGLTENAKNELLVQWTEKQYQANLLVLFCFLFSSFHQWKKNVEIFNEQIICLASPSSLCTVIFAISKLWAFSHCYFVFIRRWVNLWLCALVYCFHHACYGRCHCC